MAERSLLFACLVLLACNNTARTGPRDLSLAAVATGDVLGPLISVSSSEIDLPEGVAIAINRTPGPAVDYARPPVSNDPAIASVRATTDFDTFLVVGLRPGTTVLHFPDGETKDVPIVVSSQQPCNCPNGCCDGSRRCLPGTDIKACGGGGLVCVDCVQGGFETCNTTLHTCTKNLPTCDVTSCPNGCCIGSQKVCASGTSSLACGAGGNACVDCAAAGQVCDTDKHRCN